MDWSSDLSYIVGLMTTDGNLSKDGRHLNLTSKDFDQIENFAKILNLKNKVSFKKSGYTKQKDYYFLQFGDVKLYRFLVSIGLHPNKSKTLKALAIPNEYFPDFLRGHFDGDGFSYSYWDKRWKSSFLLYTGFTSASKDHLIWIKDKIHKLFEVDGNIKTSGKSAYQLVFAKKSSLILLRKLYYSDTITYLPRKKYKFDESLGIISKQAGMLKLVDKHA